MPKADGDPTKRNEGSSSEEPVKPNPATQPDEIPPVHVLEAMQDQDRKETEDLLAGFDRPARTPKQPAVNRDFVDFHLKREKGPRSDPPKRQRSQHDVSTVLVPKKPPVPYLLWIGAAAAVIALGVIGAFVVTSSGNDAKNASATPSAATTISAATTPSSERSAEIPPPPPPETVAQPVETAPSNLTAPPVPTTTPAKRDPKTRPTTSSTTEPVAPATTTLTTATPPTTKPPARDDFIRDL